MFEFITRLFDTSGFTPRANCGDGWTTALVWMHTGGDLFIWLAYLSIPLILVYFNRRRDLPYPGLFILFALFILACGFGHLLEALMFQYPVYWLAGVWKVFTAVVSWATVFALVPVVPRVMAAMSAAPAPVAGTRAASPGDRARLGDYIVAILAGVLALLIRGAIDELVLTDHAYVLALLMVVFVSWQSGFGPGIVTLVVSMIGMVYFFVHPRRTFVVEDFGNQLATAMFFFCGVCCAALGEAQRVARRRAREALAVALGQKDELAAEVARRQAVEEAERESEERFRSMADSAPAMIWVSDLDRRRTYFNRTWLEFTGRAVDEELGDGWIADIHPEDRDRYLTAYAGAFDTRKPFEIEYRLRRHDNTYRWVLARGTPRFTPSGGFAGFVGLCLDVTDRKRAEDDLRRSDRRFRTLTEAIPQMVWNADANGEVTYFNQRWQEYTGIPVAEAAGRGWLAAVHPEDVERVHTAWQLTVRNAPGAADRFAHEFRLRHAADDSYRWMLSVAVSLTGADDTVDQWIGSIADIDDQKRAAENLERTVRKRTAELAAEVDERARAEAEVRAQREFLDAILANVTDGIVACDESGALTLFNRAAQDFHGVPPRPLAPDAWAGEYNLFRPDGITPLPKEEVPLFRALRGERVRDAEMVIAPLRGPTRLLLASGQRLTDDAGRNLGAVVSMRDVTERREADRQLAEASAELRRANEELARSNGELEQFAYVASHDLQEPLRKIQAFGDRLAKKFRAELPDAGKEYVDRMLASAGRMRRLIDDLLTFSRVTSQARPFVSTDLGKLVHEVVGDLSDRIEQTDAEVRVGELPTIDADPTQMRQVFQNLIANSLKFHQPGVPPVVEVSGELVSEPAAGGEPVPLCRVTVRDNGIGFNEKYLDRIFQVFQRLHGREEYEGTGVGLAICHKITERHGGTITARSSPGEGAAFVVTLPVSHLYPPDASSAGPGG